MQHSIIGENLSIIGWSLKLTLEDRDELIQAVTLYKILLKSLGEAIEFRDGLSSMKIQEFMKKTPKIFMEYYCIFECDDLNSGISTMYIAIYIAMYNNAFT